MCANLPNNAHARQHVCDACHALVSGCPAAVERRELFAELEVLLQLLSHVLRRRSAHGILWRAHTAEEAVALSLPELEDARAEDADPDVGGATAPTETLAVLQRVLQAQLSHRRTQRRPRDGDANHAMVQEEGIRFFLVFVKKKSADQMLKRKEWSHSYLHGTLGTTD